jgi:hypothetical protein
MAKPNHSRNTTLIKRLVPTEGCIIYLLLHQKQPVQLQNLTRYDFVPFSLQIQLRSMGVDLWDSVLVVVHHIVATTKVTIL